MVLKAARQAVRHYGTSLFRADTPKGQDRTYGAYMASVLTTLQVTPGTGFISKRIPIFIAWRLFLLSGDWEP